ncbi:MULTISPECIES: DMT family transporter [unclassified Novosphingobium]|uniref:DMT family transporter n=1 Tax=unclassified Novosphingobium TaxID=2644732 RepID=UPI000D30F629|nr:MULTISPECIES: DMT family transporter [unclassified Novosphingobium]PTR05804.1 drug/metabolite transporter (DMT)-like permease [Novosphingobium sp. GV055]PUA94362.1 drug/metabolite transporter (DMT)-like permease [Novosphingobium sp. GV061]PUB12668.1 drug/metabolite transporter (DMT)-like permease [Novosphingobium sp. GV079]PUB38033.1 drug/metabolite transporter (DMT)-like permease [Novosphingobium sp. GV027]
MAHVSLSFGPVIALFSAALFGASTPFAKLLLGDGLDAWMLAGLLYLGSGLGLLAVWMLHAKKKDEACLVRADWGWMGLIVLAGGVAGPVLLMIGLASTPASTAALLLNVEGLATMGIAWLVLREHVDRRLLTGAMAIVAGALILSWKGGVGGVGWGSLAIVGACIPWGIDNNLTRKLSGSDPVQIAMVKGLAAGGVNLALGIARGAHLPALATMAGAGLVGFLGYGVRLVLFVLALRHLGSARTGAYFSSAPFIGALIAIALPGDTVAPRLIVAAVLMIIGLYLHLAESHDHSHVHEPIEHAHAHVHDEHHCHEHGPDDPSGEPHSHAHAHVRLVHAHRHYPDLHHRHGHA